MNPWLLTVESIQTGAGKIIAVMMLICSALVSLTVFFLLHNRTWLRWAAAAAGLALAVAALLLSFPGKSPESETTPDPIPVTEGDPRDTVEAFFDALSSSNYEAAYGCLLSSTPLGLEHLPEDEAAQLMRDALLESYTCRLRGGSVIDELTAVQSVSFSFLDLDAMQADLREGTELRLRRLSEEKARPDISDEEGRFLPEVSRTAYLDALGETLSHPEDYTATEELQLQLIWDGSAWRIVPDRALLDALAGHCQQPEGGEAHG